MKNIFFAVSIIAMVVIGIAVWVYADALLYAILEYPFYCLALFVFLAIGANLGYLKSKY